MHLLADTALRVLFVGNSLTGYNDLPGIVAAMARSRGVELDVHSVVRSGASVQDHWDEGSALRMIRAEHWDVVVFQHGPSASADGRGALREAMARFAPIVRAAGGRPALYMVWPFASQPENFDAVRESYALAARDVDGLFLPAGEAWRAAMRDDASVALYDEDGLHPTPAGSYAAALVIYAGLTGTSPIGLPAALDVRGRRLAVTPAQAELLQRAAASALAAFPPEARSSVAFRIPGHDNFPEGISCSAKRVCYVSSVRHGKVIRVGSDGVATDLFPAGRDGVLGALGVAISRDERLLWVSSAMIPQFSGYQEADSLAAAVHAFELASGRLSRRLSFPAGSGRHQPGDVYVARDGEIFVSDSRQPILYRVPDAGDTLEVYATDPLFRSLQGVAESEDGRRLYIADYSRGILAIDRETRRVRPVPAPGGTAVRGVDGLARHGGMLVGIQNGSSPARVIGMRLARDGERITSVELLDRHLPLADQPTIGSVVGTDFFYVANSQWEQYDGAGKAKEGASFGEAAVLRLPLE